MAKTIGKSCSNQYQIMPEVIPKISVMGLIDAGMFMGTVGHNTSEARRNAKAYFVLLDKKPKNK